MPNSKNLPITICPTCAYYEFHKNSSVPHSVTVRMPVVLLTTVKLVVIRTKKVMIKLQNLQACLISSSLLEPAEVPNTSAGFTYFGEKDIDL